MKTLTETAFKTQVFDYETNKEWKYNGDLPAIIDFYADWCGPCRALSPVLKELSEEYEGKVQIYKVDTEASPALSAAFGIRSIPSLLFIPKSGMPSMAAGALPKTELKKLITEVLGVAKT